ncbi:MAG: hypothetical protein C0613_02655 [Desulfobulbaceae bacterium]|nr:MAG: hypothetical protein C0613_02655 [Desulfobulbaceae bacterium]
MRRLLLMAWVILLCLMEASAAHAQLKRIVFIRYPIPASHFTTVLDGFKTTMSQQGFQEGRQVEYIDIITRSADTTSIPEVVAAVKQWRDRADLIVTCGWVSMYARPLLKESRTMQLFLPVLKSVAQTMLPSVTKQPRTNLTGLYLMYPPEKILRLCRLLLPGMTRYAYIYDSRIPADMIFKSGYQKLPTAQRYDIDLHLFDLAAGIDTVLMQLREHKIEAYGGIVGSFTLRQELASSKLPVITSFTLDIDQQDLATFVQEGNIVAGLYNPFRYCGEQGALITADIFSGRTTIEQSSPRPAMQLAFVNLAAARRLGLHVSLAALDAVDIVVQ